MADAERGPVAGSEAMEPVGAGRGLSDGTRAQSSDLGPAVKRLLPNGHAVSIGGFDLDAVEQAVRQVGNDPTALRDWACELMELVFEMGTELDAARVSLSISRQHLLAARTEVVELRTAAALANSLRATLSGGANAEENAPQKAASQQSDDEGIALEAADDPNEGGANSEARPVNVHDHGLVREMQDALAASLAEARRIRMLKNGVEDALSIARQDLFRERGRADQLEIRLEALQGEFEEFQRSSIVRAQQETTQIADLECALAEAREEAARLSEDIAAEARKSEAFAVEVLALKEDLAEARTSADARSEAVAARTAELEGLIADLRQCAGAAETDAAHQTRRADGLELALRDLQRLHDKSLQDALSAARMNAEHVAELEANLEGLRSSLQAELLVRKALETKLEEEGRVAAALQANLSNRIVGLEATIDQRTADLESKLGQVASQGAEVVKERDYLRDAAAILERSNTRKAEMIDGLRADYMGLKRQFDALSADVVRQRSLGDQLLATARLHEHAWRAAEKKAGVLQAKVESLSGELDAYRGMLEASASEAAALAASVADLDGRRIAAEQASDGFKSKLIALESEFRLVAASAQVALERRHAITKAVSRMRKSPFAFLLSWPKELEWR